MDHVTRNALAAQNNEAYGQDSRSVQSFAIVPDRILLLGVFTLELEMDYPSETSLCTVGPSPTNNPSPIFSESRGRLYTGYMKRIIHLQTARQN